MLRRHTQSCCLCWESTPCQ